VSPKSKHRGRELGSTRACGSQLTHAAVRVAANGVAKLSVAEAPSPKEVSEEEEEEEEAIVRSQPVSLDSSIHPTA
jgi:hypothetical protein